MSLALMNLSCLIKFLLSMKPSWRRSSVECDWEFVSQFFSSCFCSFCPHLLPLSIHQKLSIHMVSARLWRARSGICNDGTSPIVRNYEIMNKNSHDTAYCWMAMQRLRCRSLYFVHRYRLLFRRLGPVQKLRIHFNIFSFSVLFYHFRIA